MSSYVDKQVGILIPDICDKMKNMVNASQSNQPQTFKPHADTTQGNTELRPNEQGPRNIKM